MGFASLNPSYEFGATVGWVELLRNPSRMRLRNTT
jgi:hypothetical protein